MDEQFTKQSDDKHVVVATKLSRTAAEKLARIAKAKGLTIYELIKMVCDTLIRYMDDRHNLTAEMEQAMSIFEHMVGWADALNLADPTVQKEVAQAVYILQDADGKRKGFRATMVSKPFMGIWDETNNVMQIFERLFNILLPELYMKLFRARIILECNNVTEVINTLLDAEIIQHMNDDFRRSFEDAGRSDNGREIAYGNKAKSKQHRTPDSIAQDQRIKFDDYDKDLAETEVRDGDR